MNDFDQDELDRELSALYPSDDSTGFRDRVMRRIAAEDASVRSRATSVTGDHESHRSNATPVWRRRVLTFCGGGLAAGLLAAVIFLQGHHANTNVHASELRLQDVTGKVEIVAADGRIRKPGEGARIHPGDTLKTMGDSSATVLAKDGARLTLTRDASLTWSEDEQASLVLNTGLASLVRPQISQKTFVVFKTRHVTVEAPCAELLLATSSRQTDVSVRRGDAKVTCRGGNSAKVKSGQCGVAGQKNVEVRRGCPTPDEWNEDFESGVPEGYEAAYVRGGLPHGSTGAATTVLSLTDRGNERYQVFRYSDWEHGLAVIHDDTRLNFIYRFDEPQSVLARLTLRSPFPNSPELELYEFYQDNMETRERWWNVPAGRWYRVSLPVSRFQMSPSRLRKSRYPTRKPKRSSVVVGVALRLETPSTGLLIDRMWLSRGGSDDVVFEAIEGGEVGDVHLPAEEALQEDRIGWWKRLNRA